MENTTVTTIGKKKFERAKITAQIIKAADLNPGDTVEGIFMGQSEREWVDKKNGGEVKMIPQFHFKELDSEVRFNLFGDAGLKNAMASSGASEGDAIQIEKLQQVDLGNGQRVNNYDIYKLTPKADKN